VVSAVAILFPLGVRLSTLIAAGGFVAVAAVRRDRLALLAGFAWLAGFEAAFQVASLFLNRLPLGLPSPIFFITLGATTLVVAHRKGVRVHPRFLAVGVLFMIVWIATGFHLNGHQHGMFSLHTRIAGFDPTAEVLNEASKTAWALAYLWPLLGRARMASWFSRGAAAPRPAAS
jgi:hypothetical protein